MILKWIKCFGVFETDKNDSILAKGAGHKHSELSRGGLLEAQSWAGPEGLFLNLPFLLKLSQFLLLAPKRVLYIVGSWRNDLYLWTWCIFIHLFPSKDDLLPHVTGGFRGRAITVGSLEYDPWMKFVRLLDIQN